MTIRRAALVHDLGRVSVPVRIWEKNDPLTMDEWEQVRLHAYHTERVLVRSRFLAGLAAAASFHHERLDGSGYHRGIAAPSLDPIVRLLAAAADVYQAMTEPRPYRQAFPPTEAAGALTAEARRTSRLGGGQCGFGRCRTSEPAGRTAGRVDRARIRGRASPGPWAADEAGRPQSPDIDKDRRLPHPERLPQEGCLDPRAGAILFAMQHGLATQENSR